MLILVDMHISFGQTLYQGLIRPAALQPGRDRLLQQGIEHRADGDAHDGAQYACNVAADDDGTPGSPTDLPTILG